MQLNSTSPIDFNSDMKAYIFVRDAERRQEESIKEIIKDIKEIIKENFKSVKVDMTKMEEKVDKNTKMVEENFKSVKDDMTKMEEKVDKNIKMVEEKIDKNTDDMKNIKLALFLLFFVVASIQPDLRSLLAFIMKFFNI